MGTGVRPESWLKSKEGPVGEGGCGGLETKGSRYAAPRGASFLLPLHTQSRRLD